VGLYCFLANRTKVTVKLLAWLSSARSSVCPSVRNGYIVAKLIKRGTHSVRLDKKSSTLDGLKGSYALLWLNGAK